MTAAFVLTACASSGSGELDLGEASPEAAAELNMQLGVNYLQQGQREVALDKLLKALELNPRLTDAHTTIALIYEQMGDSQLADDHYQSALRYGDDDPNHQNNYGAFLCRQGEFAESVQYFVEAAENGLYATPVAALTNAGVCARKGGQLEEAEGYLRRALDLQPRFADALWQMAQLSFELDRKLQTRGFLQRLTDVSRLSPAALWLGVQVERELGDREAEARYALRLKVDHPDAPETQMLLESERGERNS